MNVIRQELAQLDLLDHANRIAQENVDAAMRFLDAAESDFDRLSHMPRIGARRKAYHPELKGLRMLPVTGFQNYLIYYVVQDDSVIVMRVLHGARDLDRILINELLLPDPD